MSFRWQGSFCYSIVDVVGVKVLVAVALIMNSYEFDRKFAGIYS